MFLASHNRPCVSILADSCSRLWEALPVHIKYSTEYRGVAKPGSSPRLLLSTYPEYLSIKFQIQRLLYHLDPSEHESVCVTSQTLLSTVVSCLSRPISANGISRGFSWIVSPFLNIDI